MSKALIAKLRTDRDTILKTIDGMQAQLADGKELDAAQLAELTKAETDLPALDARLVELADAQARRDLIDAKLGPATGVEPGASLVTTRDRQAAPGRIDVPALSPGAQFTASEGFARFAAGETRDSGLVEVNLAAVGTNSATFPLAGYFKVKDPADPRPNTHILDAAAFEPVAGSNFFYDDWSALEGEAGDVGEGAPKPELAGAAVAAPGVLGKVAVHKKVTAEALEDVAGIEAKVENILLRAVLRKAEKNAGLEVVADTKIPDLDVATAPTDLLIGIRLAIAQVFEQEFEARHVILNPKDYAAIDIDLLSKTLEGARRDAPVWQLGVAQSSVVPAGTAFVGDIFDAVTVYARRAAMVKTNYSGDDFINNLVTILAEQRITSKVTNPLALVKVVLGP